MRFRTQLFRPSAERLEARQMLAGNVLARVGAGDLIIRGDDDANAIEIAPGPAAGQFIVRGLAGTKINGVDSFTAVGVTDDALIEMAKGDDVVRVAGARLIDDFVLDTGPGNNTLEVTNAAIPRGLRLVSYAGGDTVVIENSVVGGGLNLKTGAGADTMLIEGTQIGQRLDIITGNGADALGIVASKVGGLAVLKLGADNDLLALERNTFAALATLEGGLGTDKLTEAYASINEILAGATARSFEASLAQLANVNYGYEGEIGPDHWGSLTPLFFRCSSGDAQSPINIVTANAVESDLANIQFHYELTRDLPFTDNGRAVTIDYSGANSITLDGVDYTLEAISFHAGGEHMIDGVAFPMEMHLIHRDAQGRLAIVAVLLRQGALNTAYARLVNNLPSPEAPTTVNLNAATLLPAGRRYYKYEGSLTSPPCTENVTWLVLQNPVTLSAPQLVAFSAAVGPNSRPVQPLNDRVVLHDAS